MSTRKISYAKVAVAPPPVEQLPPMQPSPSVTVTISAAEEGRVYGKPDILPLSPKKRKDLDCGYLADIYVAPKPGSDAEPTKLDVKQLSSNFICAISPVAKAQIEALPDKQKFIAKLILPHGSVEAYLMLMDWFRLIIRSGGHPGGLPPDGTNKPNTTVQVPPRA